MACLTAFVAVLMLLLWLFQVVLLDNFYQAIKTRTIKRTAQGIARNIDQQDLSQQLDSLTRQPDFYVRILDREGETVYNSRSGPMSMVHDMEKEEALRFFAAAEEKGGMVLELFRQDFPNPFAGPFGEPEAGKDDKQPDATLFVDTWFMSCRVLKRGMEQFVLNTIVDYARANGFVRIVGEYIPTAKNAQVADLYPGLGFVPVSGDERRYALDVAAYTPLKTHVKAINRG